jgi:hypothetical protein
MPEIELREHLLRLAVLQVLDERVRLLHDQHSDDEDREDRDRRISALGASFLDSVRLKCDHVAVTPRFEYHPSSAFSDFAQAPSVVRLTGTIPSDSRGFTFGYDLAAGTFALIVRIGDSAAQTIWIEGGTDSAEVSLVAPPPEARPTSQRCEESMPWNAISEWRRKRKLREMRYAVGLETIAIYERENLVEAAAALRYLVEGRPFGRVVLTI